MPMTDSSLTLAAAEEFAAIALGHVRREYPYKPDNVLDGPEDARVPSALHPIFHGSYDWHSCVHSHWMLARLLRRFPGMAAAGRIRALFDGQFVPEKVAGECAYLAAPSALGFKRPYGWAWLLKLAEELMRQDDPRWARNLAPLAELFARRFRDFLPLATYPVRVGTHFNTAFGLRMAADYAVATQDTALAGLLLETARRWYGEDADCPAWGEPGGDDFLSSALIEAECMRRLLPAVEFSPWFDRFLPRIASAEPATLFRAATVSDRTDGKLAHLDGLNLSRAWCWRALAAALPPGDPRRTAAEETAGRHLAAGLPNIASDYMGEHWLASFATLALDGG
ncbi:MAG: hypothetical protein JWR00_3817 [Rubritepida sp.]|nr:hypothetical protein [Rubritepida sp.]